MRRGGAPTSVATALRLLAREAQRERCGLLTDLARFVDVRRPHFERDAGAREQFAAARRSTSQHERQPHTREAKPTAPTASTPPLT